MFFKTHCGFTLSHYISIWGHMTKASQWIHSRTCQTITTLPSFVEDKSYKAFRAFDPSIHLTRSCIDLFPSISAPLYAVLTVPSSKTDPFRKGVAIYIAKAPGACICMVSALKLLFEHSE